MAQWYDITKDAELAEREKLRRQFPGAYSSDTLRAGTTNFEQLKDYLAQSLGSQEPIVNKFKRKLDLSDGDYRDSGGGVFQKGTQEPQTMNQLLSEMEGPKGFGQAVTGLAGDTTSNALTGLLTGKAINTLGSVKGSVAPYMENKAVKLAGKLGGKVAGGIVKKGLGKLAAGALGGPIGMTLAGLLTAKDAYDAYKSYKGAQPQGQMQPLSQTPTIQPEQDQQIQTLVDNIKIAMDKGYDINTIMKDLQTNSPDLYNKIMKQGA